ncbi:Hemolysin activation/secretion protein [Moraxella cuniculi DSM 21768]|uniref:Hemolysin activation/secretion protein n=1 Tax=Moraxella cuniculi DSM 21768 TaxID=1122245 RepID=A0A1N7FB36_9GAMM|nr:ShlB/FhaC/HecB family hemolysin secretion/activation protein [Moraxella cuniculi]OOS03543.1 hypothetical protein B0189_09225 [Moraxella cuniculi]SIR97533.1 Hemolysin activation/secretion protein [Moraxella cuniculi DSM 21768]
MVATKHAAARTHKAMLLAVLLPLSTSAFANTSQSTNLNLIQNQSLAEQRLFTQAQMAAETRAILPASVGVSSSQSLDLPNESVCFNIQQVLLDVADDAKADFQFLAKKLNKKSTGLIGSCVGEQGLQKIIDFAYYQILNQGYITSQVLLKPQDLASGQLVLSVIAGRVANIYRASDDPNIVLHNAMSIKTYDVLNLRKLEQSSQNLRLPYDTQAMIHIKPSDKTNENAGFSDLIVQRNKGNKIGTQLFVNNFGNQSTGIHQAGIGLNIAEPLWSNDNLYVQYLSTLDGINSTKLQANNQNLYLNYRYPFKNWQLKLSYNYNRYTQALAGLNHNPIYKGKTVRKQAQLSYLLYQSGDSKLTGIGEISHKDSKYYIDDLPILVQRRKSSNYRLALDFEKTFYNQSKLALEGGFSHGIGAFDALPSPERYYRDVDSRPLIWQFTGNYRLPLATANHRFGLNTRFFGQYSRDNLPAAEQFIIGDQYAVRGFDGKRLAAGNNGLVVGQEIYYQLPAKNPHQFYTAIDQGWVSADGLGSASKQATGAVLGYRFMTKRLSFDGFIGKPMRANGLSKNANVGFQIAFGY